MLIAGLLFDLGVIITCASFNLPMLIFGRILLGVAVAFASVAVTLYNSEMAPAHIRGRLNQIFQVTLLLPHTCCVAHQQRFFKDSISLSKMFGSVHQFALKIVTAVSQK